MSSSLTVSIIILNVGGLIRQLKEIISVNPKRSIEYMFLFLKSGTVFLGKKIILLSCTKCRILVPLNKESEPEPSLGKHRSVGGFSEDSPRKPLQMSTLSLKVKMER